MDNLNILESNFNTNTSKEFIYINSMTPSNINNNDFIVKLVLNGSVSNNTLNLQFIIDDGYNYLFKSNKTFVIKINNKTYNVNKNNFTLSRLYPGNYTVTVLKIIDKDNNEFLANASYLFTIDKISTVITIDSVKGKIGDKITFTAKVIDENGKIVKKGTVIFRFNGREYSAKIVDGFATITVVLPDKAGNDSVTVYFKGDSTYQDTYAVFNVEVIAKDIPNPNPNPSPNPVNGGVGNIENTGNPLLLLLIALGAISLESLRRKF